MKGKRWQIILIGLYQVLMCFELVFGRYKAMTRFYSPTYEEWGGAVANNQDYVSGLPEIVTSLAVAAKWCFALLAVAAILMYVSEAARNKKNLGVQVMILLVGIILFALYIVWIKFSVGINYMYYMNFIPVEILMVLLALEIVSARRTADNQ